MRLPERADAYCRLLAGELRRRRMARDLSQNQLAERAGLSQPMIGFIEKGVCVPTVASLFRIADALGCPPAEIFLATDALALAGAGADTNPATVKTTRPTAPPKQRRRKQKTKSAGTRREGKTPARRPAADAPRDAPASSEKSPQGKPPAAHDSA